MPAFEQLLEMNNLRFQFSRNLFHFVSVDFVSLTHAQNTFDLNINQLFQILGVTAWSTCISIGQAFENCIGVSQYSAITQVMPRFARAQFP
jgi:hypothetical protein